MLGRALLNASQIGRNNSILKHFLVSRTDYTPSYSEQESVSYAESDIDLRS
jgi:hypothetical protein